MHRCHFALLRASWIRALLSAGTTEVGWSVGRRCRRRAHGEPQVIVSRWQDARRPSRSPSRRPPAWPRGLRVAGQSADPLIQGHDDSLWPANVGHEPDVLVLTDAPDQAVAVCSQPADRRLRALRSTSRARPASRCVSRWTALSGAPTRTRATPNQVLLAARINTCSSPRAGVRAPASSP
jgi:hypothetical protein